MSNIELKPCPFCGGKPYLANVEMVGCSYVVCTDCRAQGDDATKERAVAVWNTRTHFTEVRAMVDAAKAQLQYMDLCNDKGDLERNLRAALAPFTKANP